ncbi:MAG: hypothetical protein JWR33_1500 [Naasia sp.]|jgi:hypothetical protein|uniref:hypothetical protein n=1 Tax=Naasia sp. TaxID=2546198 RepID=UPI00262AFF38|nr:hypothetical protein [Naasia sp.]MCU1570759.1 hypothetical protein [Naasia sp.]
MTSRIRVPRAVLGVAGALLLSTLAMVSVSTSAPHAEADGTTSSHGLSEYQLPTLALEEDPSAE